MNTILNVVLTAVIAGLAAAAPAVAPAYPQVAMGLGALAAILKVVDGFLTPSAQGGK